MNKTELIAKVAQMTEGTKVETAKYVEAIIEAVKVGLVEDGEVAIVGFGSFKAVDVPERAHKNPKTGEEVVKSAHKKPKFKAGKQLKELFV